MRTGRVKTFNAERGFGFIVPDDADADLFVHITEVKNKVLVVDDLVEFEIGEDKRTGRPRAVGVNVVRKARAA